MKNTKNFYIASFFACFLLPAMVVLFGALSIFTQNKFVVDVVNSFTSGGSLWILIVYEIILILITLMLGLTLKLKEAESITTDEVVKGKPRESNIKKVEAIDLTVKVLEKTSRKLVKQIEKRDIFSEEVSTPEVKKPNEVKPSAPVSNEPTTPPKVFPVNRR